MTSVEDLEKLKVEDLRKELKTRGLLCTGKKAELVQRLTEHISSEEKHILQGEDPEDSNNTSNAIDVSEEAVLGILTSPTANGKVDEEEEEEEADEMGPPQAPVKADSTKTDTSFSSPDKPKQISPKARTSSEKHTPVKGPSVVSISGKISLKSPVGQPVEEKKGPTVQGVSSGESGGSLKKVTVSSLKNLSPAERKIERAIKFETSLSMEDRKVLRAERFGLSASGTKGKSGENRDVLNKRAERFGLPTAAKLTTSVGNQEMDEKLKQRAERFGSPNVTSLSAITTGKVAVSIDDSKARLLKRKERFGPGDNREEKKEELNSKKAKRAERFSLRQ